MLDDSASICIKSGDPVHGKSAMRQEQCDFRIDWEICIVEAFISLYGLRHKFHAKGRQSRS